MLSVKSFLFLLGLTFIWILSSPLPLKAQGTCTCIVNASRMCGITNNSCESGYTPECASLAQCNGSPSSCACQTTSDPTCGGTSEPCCPGETCLDDLICVPTAAGSRCVGQSQCNLLPGGCPQPEIFCGEPGSIRTAIGCIHASDPVAFVNQIIGWALGIGSGAGFLTIVYGGFLITTAAGDVNRLKAGQQVVFSALAGLALIAIAVVLLNFVGVNILRLDLFGFSNP